MKKHAAFIFTLLCLFGLLTGCITTGKKDRPTTPSGVSSTQHPAITLIEQGQARAAAQQLEAEAAQQRGARQALLLADAAFAWHMAKESARARELLTRVQARQLSGATAQRYALLNAELALADGQPANVGQWLSGSPDHLIPAWQARWYLAKARQFEASRQVFDAAMMRARAGELLTDNQARSRNQQAISALLARLDNATLAGRTAALATSDPMYNYAGRALIARGLPLPRPFQRENFARSIRQRPPAEADGYRPPLKMAVLLPFTGEMATAAAPVRDGLLAGYYARARRPDIEFIDTQSTPAGALAAYDQAVANGADFIIGPLNREAVGALFQRGSLPVPLLALNRSPTPLALPAGSLSFALAPEDDGIMAAEYLLTRQRKRVLVLEGNDDNGRRAAAAFSTRLTERGGQVIGKIEASTLPMGLGEQVREAGGVDALFLAMRGNHARAIVPQLRLAGLGDIPRVGIWQLLSGSMPSETDTVLDGIAFPRETWAVRRVNGLPDANALGAALPTARGAAARLFAFGFDAWTVSVYLEKLVGMTHGSLPGATGKLNLDGFGNVLRTPAWSMFRGGQPVLLADR